MALVIPTDLEFLAAIYAFGATLAFTIVHLSVIRLRFREPDRDRPYKVPFNVRMGRAELPLTRGPRRRDGRGRIRVCDRPARRRALRRRGLDGVRGAALRDLPRGRGKADLQARHGAGKGADRKGVQAEFGSILVPVLGTPLDDDIMQTAGRLAGEENEDVGEGGAVIEALWVFEVPMALPLD